MCILLQLKIKFKQARGKVYSSNQNSKMAHESFPHAHILYDLLLSVGRTCEYNEISLLALSCFYGKDKGIFEM